MTLYEEVAEIREEIGKILDKHTFAAVKQYCREECIPVPMYDIFNPLTGGCCSFEDWRRDNERLVRWASNENT